MNHLTTRTGHCSQFRVGNEQLACVGVPHKYLGHRCQAQGHFSPKRKLVDCFQPNSAKTIRYNPPGRKKPGHLAHGRTRGQCLWAFQEAENTTSPILKLECLPTESSGSEIGSPLVAALLASRRPHDRLLKGGAQLTAEAHGNTKAQAVKSRLRGPPPPESLSEGHSKPLGRLAHGARAGSWRPPSRAADDGGEDAKSHDTHHTQGVGPRHLLGKWSRAYLHAAKIRGWQGLGWRASGKAEASWLRWGWRWVVGVGSSEEDIHPCHDATMDASLSKRRLRFAVSVLEGQENAFLRGHHLLTLWRPAIWDARSRGGPFI